MHILLNNLRSEGNQTKKFDIFLFKNSADNETRRVVLDPSSGSTFYFQNALYIVVELDIQ